MAIEIKAPHSFAHVDKRMTIFLGGVIDQGSAPNWQKTIVDALEPYDNCYILNPRRDAWDSLWEQSIDNQQFREQVEWELDAQDSAEIIVYVFAPDEESAKTSKAPITLLELGLYIDSCVLVVCPPGYYQKGNVDIVCQRYKIPVLESVKDLIECLLDEDCEKSASLPRI